MKKIISGVVVFLAGLWGGSWFCDYVGMHGTYGFAAFTTSLIFTVSGMFMVVFGFLEKDL